MLRRGEGLYSKRELEQELANARFAACTAVGAAQAGYYRCHRTSPAPPRPTPTP
ncbi:MAG TPA: hypothetical protein VN748_18175 [Pseudonocardiaceae bacterium]|nr:hypothetical protein [Pseudonocardiaceae bacterium]